MYIYIYIYIYIHTYAALVEKYPIKFNNVVELVMRCDVKVQVYYALNMYSSRTRQKDPRIELGML